MTITPTEGTLAAPEASMTRQADCLCALEGTPGKQWHITGYDPFDGSPAGYATPCEACEGHPGVVEVEDEPCDIEDLEERCAIPPSPSDISRAFDTCRDMIMGVTPVTEPADRPRPATYLCWDADFTARQIVARMRTAPQEFGPDEIACLLAARDQLGDALERAR